MLGIILAINSNAHASFFGVSNDAISTCNYTSLTAAVAKAQEANGTVYVQQGIGLNITSDLIIDESVTIRRGTSTCNSGGTGVVTFDFNDGAHIEVEENTLIMADMILREGDFANLRVSGGGSGSNTAWFMGYNMQFIDGTGINGGNVSVQGSTYADARFNCDDCTFTTGVASGDGGGMYIGSYSTVVLTGDQYFTNNSAGDDGGAIYISTSADTSVSLPENFTFSGNTATGTGPEVQVGSSVTMFMD